MKENKTNELQTLTAAQACKLLQVSKGTLLKYVDEGYLNAYKLPSGAWRFKAIDVAAFIEGGAVAAGDKE